MSIKEKYISYLLNRAEILNLKESDNTMSSVPTIVKILTGKDVTLNGMDFSPIDLTIETLNTISLEMNNIGRRHGLCDTMGYDEFISNNRDSKLDDLGI